MNIQNITAARTTVQEIGRLGDIANSPAGRDLGAMASSTDQLLAARTRQVPQSVLDRIGQSHGEVTRSGAAFPTDAEIRAARYPLKAARFRLAHPALGFARDHPTATGIVGTAASLGLALGGAELYFRNRDRERKRSGPGTQNLAAPLVFGNDNTWDDRFTRADTRHGSRAARQKAAAVFALPDRLRYTPADGHGAAGKPLPRDLRALNDDGTLSWADAHDLLLYYDTGPRKDDISDGALNDDERARVYADFARAGVPTKFLDEWLDR